MSEPGRPATPDMPAADFGPWREVSGELNGTVRHALRSAQTEATPADTLMIWAFCGT